MITLHHNGFIDTLARMELSRRVRSLPASPTLAINSLAKQMRAQGVDVLSYAAGEPDFDTPDAIKTAAHEALDAGLTRYVASAGDPVARQTSKLSSPADSNDPMLPISVASDDSDSARSFAGNVEMLKPILNKESVSKGAPR